MLNTSKNTNSSNTFAQQFSTLVNGVYGDMKEFSDRPLKTTTLKTAKAARKHYQSKADQDILLNMRKVMTRDFDEFYGDTFELNEEKPFEVSEELEIPDFPVLEDISDVLEDIGDFDDFDINNDDVFDLPIFDII